MWQFGTVIAVTMWQLPPGKVLNFGIFWSKMHIFWAPDPRPCLDQFRACNLGSHSFLVSGISVDASDQHALAWTELVRHNTSNLRLSPTLQSLFMIWFPFIGRTYLSRKWTNGPALIQSGFPSSPLRNSLGSCRSIDNCGCTILG